MKIIGAIVFGLVTWAISDAVFNVIYTTIDNAVMSTGGSVSLLLKASKVVFGFLAYDGVSFACGVLAATLSIFKLVKTID
jgi:hypothetical protein